MSDIEEAIKIIKQGGVVIFPTDTAFGIGCRIDDEKTVERLFAIRKRPQDMATPVLFDSIERVKEFVIPFGAQGKPFDSKVEQLMRKYWPGALTLILYCNKVKVPSLVRAGGETLGVRIPDHEIPIQIVRGADIPILGPSANFHGEKTPYSFPELDKDLVKLVDFVLDGKTKTKNLTSTVVDCSVLPFKILRQGAVSLGYE